MELIQRCVSDVQLIEEGDPSKNYLIGIDFAKKKDETVLIVLERMSDRRLIVRHIDAWSQMNYAEQIARIGEICQRFRIIGGAADQTGVGEAVLEDLKKIAPCVTGVTFNQKTKFELASTLRFMMEHRRLIIPDHKRLKMQLNSVGYQVSRPGHILFQPSPNQHDDHFWALALAVYSSRELSPYALGGTPQTVSR
jgi:phage FluMu gp28-like protein